MWRDLLTLALLACQVIFSYGDLSYTIVGSKVIQANSKYGVSVTLHNATGPCTVQLTIQNDKDFAQSKGVTVQPYTTQVVEFAISELPQGEYKFVAVGQSGCTFTNETSINLQVKYQSVFIQTDKAMYKPGEKVQFRILVLDSELNPAEISEMDVYITDATQNRIKQWLNVETTMGVYVQELQLAATLTLGIWNINVNVNGESHSKEFELAEYVLPKYEVTVSAPNDVTYSDGVVRVTANAKYTYGKNVKGVVVVSISQKTWSETPSPTIIEKQVDIDGTAFVEFQIKGELNVGPENYQSEFDIKASVTEGVTGNVIEASSDVTIRQYKFTVTNTDNDYSYTPGEEFTLNLQFAYYDGSPYVDTTNPIKIIYGPNYDNSNVTYLTTGYMNFDGSAEIPITLPDGDYGFYVFVQFLDYNNNVGNYYKASPSTDENSISAKLLTKNPKVNDEISIEITSTKETSSFTYLLSARGKLILSATESVPDQKSLTITLQASFDMVPTAQFVVYYLTGGDIVSTRIEIAVTGLNNFVTLETSAIEKQPGEAVDITISTKPLSNVCVLGVDQSVVLLKTGNDIVQSDVYNDLDQYNTVQYSPVGGPVPRPIGGPVLAVDAVDAEVVDPVERKKRAILPWGGGGGFQDFDNANVFLFSNANEPPFIYPWIMFNNAVPEIAAAQDASAGSAAPQTSAPTIRKNFPETWIWNCTNSGKNVPIALGSAAGGPLPAPAPSQNADNPTIRKYFPETWIWNCNLSGTGSVTLPQTAPDTITSWFITAFATNNEYGLGVTDDKTIFKVFKQFFISLNLPYNVKRDETLAVSIAVFNYMSQNVTATVTLDNSLKEFEFTGPHTQLYRKKGCPQPIESSRSKSVKIASNDATQVTFLITPLIVGPLTIKVTATSSIAGDAIQVILPVVAEGVTQYKNKPQFIDLRKSKTSSTVLTVEIPDNAVPNSTLVTFSAIGNIMGVTLKNIDSLIQLPCGCGEQTMIGLAPDVAILKYLTKTGLLTTAIENQLISYLETGYQSELTYLHPDGSFSAFGTQDDSGSSWLTAFVCRIFIEASEFITIDKAVITRGLKWLISLQKSDGSFPEPGRVIHSDMQGEASKGVPLTAYIASVLAQDKTNAETYADVIKKALDYVKTTLDVDTLDDIYSLAVACYAAQLANHSSKDALLQKFDASANVKGGLKSWEKVELAAPDPWSRPLSVNVEITAYGLLAYIIAGRIVDGLPIMKWLLSQQGSSGGFSSTQDTVQGVTSLAEFASQISGGNTMSCQIAYEKSQSTININQDNALVLQSIELPSTTRNVTVKCTGSGFSLVQLSYQFNLDVAEISPRFNLDVKIDNSSSDYNLILNICTSFIAGDDGNTSNMAVIEADFPTGYVADLQTIKDTLGQTKGVKKIETKNANTIVVIYLDSVTTVQICLQITAYQICEVADAKPVSVSAYDYYDNNRRKTTFYQIKSKDVCAICDDDDCNANCGESVKEPSCPKKQSPVSKKPISGGAQKAIDRVLQWLKDLLRRLRS